MFEGFQLTTVSTGEVDLRVRHGGSGPPLLLLHGLPQTHAMWCKIAPHLATDFTVVAPDLRGYGDSSKPESSPTLKRIRSELWQRDAIALMRTLGIRSLQRRWPRSRWPVRL